MCSSFVLFFQCGVAWRIKLVTLGSSWTGPFHDFVEDARWQIILIYEQHELKLMWTHVQFAWWWYLELRRDRNVICIMRYEPNLVLWWIVVELASIQLSPLKKTFESSWVLVYLRKEEDSLLSLVLHKQLLSLSTTLLVELSSLPCILLSLCKMVLSLLIAIEWWWAKLWWAVLESEELDKHNMLLPSLFGTLCTMGQWWQKACTLNTWLEYQLLCWLPWCILNMYLHTSQK